MEENKRTQTQAPGSIPERLHIMQLENAQLQMDCIQSILFDSPFLSNSEKQVFICEMRQMLNAAEEHLRNETDRLFHYEDHADRMVQLYKEYIGNHEELSIRPRDA